MYNHRSLAILLACVSLVILGCRAPTAANALEDMLRILPADAGVTYVDVDTIYNDDDLRHLFEDIEDDWDEYLEDDFDIELANLAYVAVGFAVGENGGGLFLLGGGLGGDDLDNLRSELAFMGYDDDELRDVEVWIDTSESWEAVAFLDGNRVLMAEDEDAMEDALRRMDSEAFSLYDRVGDILSDLPSGMLMGVGNNLLETFGTAVQKKGSDKIEIISIQRFENEEDAMTAEIRAKDSSGECDEEVARNGLKVTTSQVCELDYFMDYFYIGL